MISPHSKIGLLLILAFVACIIRVRPVYADAAENEIHRSDAVNYVVLVEGTVSLKRQGWSAYVPVTFGTPVYTGDLLRVNEGSRYKIVCSDLSVREVFSGISGVPCTAPIGIFRRSTGSDIVYREKGFFYTGRRTYEGWSDTWPIVLSPRKTKLLSAHPLLRWTSVTGASTYTVTVLGPQLNWVGHVKGATEIFYPDDAPHLVPGVNYKLVIKAESSFTKTGTGPAFSLLESKERETVETEESRLRALGLPEGPTQFLIARLYSAHGLSAEAIQSLERISKTFNVGAVARSLADLYLNVGLARQAEPQYLESIRLATVEKDKEGIMLSHMALAKIYADSAKDTKLAGRHFEETLALAREIGDMSLIEEAETRLARLQAALPPN